MAGDIARTVTVTGLDSLTLTPADLWAERYGEAS
jgi:hypothetical protein